MTYEIVRDACCNYWHITPEEFSGIETRRNRIAKIRQVAMYLLRNVAECSFTDIAVMFHRNHTTVIYSVNKITFAMFRDDELRRQIEILRDITSKPRAVTV